MNPQKGERPKPGTMLYYGCVGCWLIANDGIKVASPTRKVSWETGPPLATVERDFSPWVIKTRLFEGIPYQSAGVSQIYDMKQVEDKLLDNQNSETCSVLG